MKRKLYFYGFLGFCLILVIYFFRVPQLVSPVPDNRGLFVTFHSPPPTLPATPSATLKPKVKPAATKAPIKIASDSSDLE
jgi:hypothetical protein